MKQQIALKRLDRIDAELMRLEGELMELHFSFKGRMELLEEQLKGKLSDKDFQVQMDKARAEPMREYMNKREWFEQRTSTLKKTREELEATLDKASEKSVELTALAAKLEQNQQIANDVTMKLQRAELEADAPTHDSARIRGGNRHRCRLAAAHTTEAKLATLVSPPARPQHLRAGNLAAKAARPAH